MATEKENFALTRSQRHQQFVSLLKDDIIDLENLRNITFGTGCLDDQNLRATVWKILLNYLPLDKDKWKDYLSKQRNDYLNFVNEFVLTSHDEDDCKVNSEGEDHPLNPNPKSKWNKFFHDNEMLLQIDKDCRRLYPDLDFFQRPTPYRLPCFTKNSEIFSALRQRVECTKLKSENIGRDWKGLTLPFNKTPKWNKINDLSGLVKGEEAHWEVVERILFIYSKLNSCQGYVQGMNEIIGPLYYVLIQDVENQEFVECDTFWCFTNLMGEIRDNFNKHLDDSNFGIVQMMDKFMNTLRTLDVSLWDRMNELEIKPQFYSFRWLTLLLSQEFQLPELLRIWDSLFADKKRFNFLIYVCCAMLILRRIDIFNGDFSLVVKLVQNYPQEDVHRILGKAAELAGMK